MEPKKLDKLISRFYAGETSLEEEEQLREYFLRNKEFPAQYQDVRKQLQFYEDVETAGDDKFPGDLEEFIDRLDEPRTISLRKRYLYRITAVAAGIALLIGLFFSLNNTDQQTKSYAFEETFSDNPQLAYEQTQKILMYVSGRLNHGIDELENIEKLEEPSQKLEPLTKMGEELNRLKILNELDNKDLKK